MTDALAAQVDIDKPQSANIADLIKLPPPINPIQRQPGELIAYELTGTITLAKLETDKDIHMVLSDGQHTMIIEAVSPDCAETSRVLPQITDVRKTVEAQFPQAANGGREANIAVPVTVTGVAFFDHLHGQAGVAPNGIELHPVLLFQAHPNPHPKP